VSKNSQIQGQRLDIIETRRQKNYTERKTETGVGVDGTNRRRTHSARLIRESDHNLPFPASARQLVPLFLWRTHIVEIGSESDPTHVDVVAHVVCNTVAAAFGFISTEVAL